MKHFEILGIFLFRDGLREEAQGIAIVACFLLAAGFFVWRMSRFLKRDAATELEHERQGKNRG